MWLIQGGIFSVLTIYLCVCVCMCVCVYTSEFGHSAYFRSVYYVQVPGGNISDEKEFICFDTLERKIERQYQ